MARWRLTEPHYLNLRNGESRWEYMETDRNTGRQKRQTFEVPRYFHHEDPNDWNVMEGRDYGYVAVCDGNNPQPNDVIFMGEPTPGMRPLDAEAEAINAKLQPKWNTIGGGSLNPNENSWADKMVDGFMQQADKINMKLTELQPANGMTEFMQAMTNIMAQNQKILMAIVGKQLGVTPVVDNLEPLGEPEAPTEEELSVEVESPAVPPPPITRGERLARRM